jgi:hypothetical protein
LHYVERKHAGAPFDPEKASAQLTRWTIDTSAAPDPGDGTTAFAQHKLTDCSGEFPAHRRPLGDARVPVRGHQPDRRARREARRRDVYTNTDGVWKIKKLWYRAFWHGTVEHGWAYTPVDYVPNASVLYPEDPYGPDQLLENAPRLWPETTTLPFHYKHPVTGKAFVPDNWGAFPDA